MKLGEGSGIGWFAAAAVAIVAILAGSGLWVFHSLRSVPGEVVESGLEAVDKARRIAAAFRHGTIETTFINYASELSGSSRLQVASLRQVEVYTRTEEGSVLWGQIALPEVVVAATVPVEYTYYLDLEEAWTFEVDDATLWVQAPRLRFNSPALDVSELNFDVRESSLLRDEEAVIDSLKAGLTELSRDRARSHVSLVRETARREVEKFVSTWLAGHFDDAGSYRIEVVFADEVPELEKSRARG